MVHRDKCPFSLFINSKPQKCGIKVRVADDAKSFNASNLLVYTSRPLKQGRK
jgi:hypothetical protein